MDRVTALNTIVNDSTRSDFDREVARRALANIATNAPDAHERQAARRVLPDQSQVDSDLEQALDSKSFGGYRAYSEFRNRLSDDTRQLLNDMLDPLVLALPPKSGAIERLKNLYTASQSLAVKNRTLEALEAIASLELRGKTMAQRAAIEAKKPQVTDVAA